MYRPDKLDPMLRLDVSSSGEGVTYNYHSQDGRCWLIAANQSPFDFTIDRVAVSVSAEGGTFRCSRIFPEKIPPMGTSSILTDGKTPMLQDAAKMARSSKRVNLHVEAFVITKMHTFVVRRYINDVKNFEIHA